MGALIYRPGEGEVHEASGSQIVIKAAGEHTGGTLFCSETTLAPGFPGPPAHRHETLHDMFYVLDGILEVRVEDETHDLTAGTFACVPPGVAHSFRNASDAPVRFLNFNTPAGFEHYMRDLAKAATQGPLTRDIIGLVASRYDFHPA